MVLFPLVRLFHFFDERRKLVLRLKFHISVSVRSQPPEDSRRALLPSCDGLGISLLRIVRSSWGRVISGAVQERPMKAPVSSSAFLLHRSRCIGQWFSPYRQTVYVSGFLMKKPSCCVVGWVRIQVKNRSNHAGALTSMREQRSETLYARTGFCFQKRQDMLNIPLLHSGLRFWCSSSVDPFMSRRPETFPYEPSPSKYFLMVRSA